MCARGCRCNAVRARLLRRHSFLFGRKLPFSTISKTLSSVYIYLLAPLHNPASCELVSTFTGSLHF